MHRSARCHVGRGLLSLREAEDVGKVEYQRQDDDGQEAKSRMINDPLH